MSSSYCNLLYHIVFSTKRREPWLTPEIRARTHEYLGGAIRNEEGIAMIINGTADHVHILAKLRQDKAIPKVVGELKANSSGWISRTFKGAVRFGWQEGIGTHHFAGTHFTSRNETMLAKRRYAPGTPAGNCRNHA
jgi:putative transposase